MTRSLRCTFSLIANRVPEPAAAETRPRSAHNSAAPRYACLTRERAAGPRACYGDGAGDGNRTHVTSLEGWRTTIVLRPRRVNRWPARRSGQGQRLEYLDF